MASSELDKIVALFEEEPKSLGDRVAASLREPGRFEGLERLITTGHRPLSPRHVDFEVRGDHVIAPEYCYIIGPGPGEALLGADGEPLGRDEGLQSVARAAQETTDISSQEAFERLLDHLAQCQCHFEVRGHYGTCTDEAELTVDMSLTAEELIELRRRVDEVRVARWMPMEALYPHVRRALEELRSEGEGMDAVRSCDAGVFVEGGEPQECPFDMEAQEGTGEMVLESQEPPLSVEEMVEMRAEVEPYRRAVDRFIRRINEING